MNCIFNLFLWLISTTFYVVFSVRVRVRVSLRIVLFWWGRLIFNLALVFVDDLHSADNTTLQHDLYSPGVFCSIGKMSLDNTSS
jgi:hypothetical protein